MYIPEHDGEMQIALRIIAETRKNLETSGDVAGLETLDHALQIQRSVILASTVRASANAWRRLAHDVDMVEATDSRFRASMSERTYRRVWGFIRHEMFTRVLNERKER